MRELVDRRRAHQPRPIAMRFIRSLTTHAGVAQLSHSFLDMAQQLSRRSDYIATFSAHLTHE